MENEKFLFEHEIRLKQEFKEKVKKYAIIRWEIAVSAGYFDIRWGCGRSFP